MRTGTDARTGMLLTGWDHCVQSIGIILTTRFGSRVMQRDFGSRLADLQDRNGTPKLIMEMYAAVAEALRRWEPGFRLRTVQLMRAGADGVFAFEIAGIFYPRGHLGDYTVSEERSALIGAGESGFRILVAS